MPYYGGLISVDANGMRLSGIRVNKYYPLKEKLPNFMTAPKPVKVGKYKWQRHLRHMSAAGWQALNAVRPIPNLSKDAQGPFVTYGRRQKMLRPNDCQPV